MADLKESRNAGQFLLTSPLNLRSCNLRSLAFTIVAGGVNEAGTKEKN